MGLLGLGTLPSSAAIFTGPSIFRGDISLQLSTNAPLGTAVSTNANGGSWTGGGTQTFYYAVQFTNSTGISLPGTTVRGTTGSSNSSLIVKWSLTAGADAFFLWRGSATNALTNYVRIAATITNLTDTGTNAWSVGAIATTATNVPRLIFADGSSLSSTNGLGGGGGGGATQLVAIAVSSPTNYIESPGTITGQVLYVHYCVTNGGSGGANLATLSNSVLSVGAVASNALVRGSNTNLPEMLFAGGDDGGTTGYGFSFVAGAPSGDSQSGNFSFTGGNGGGSGAVGADFTVTVPSLGGGGGNVRFVGAYGGSPTNSGFYVTDFDRIVFARSGLSTAPTNFVIDGYSVIVSNGQMYGKFVGDGSGLTNLPPIAEGFRWRRQEGSTAIFASDRLPIGTDTLSVSTPTNEMTYGLFLTSASTLAVTSPISFRMIQPRSGVIRFPIIANQPSGTYAVVLKGTEGSTAGGTQTVSSAFTESYLSITCNFTAVNGQLTTTLSTSNAANLYLGGVDQR